jgi:hypothetical protein
VEWAATRDPAARSRGATVRRPFRERRSRSERAACVSAGPPRGRGCAFRRARGRGAQPAPALGAFPRGLPRRRHRREPGARCALGLGSTRRTGAAGAERARGTRRQRLACRAAGGAPVRAWAARACRVAGLGAGGGPPFARVRVAIRGRAWGGRRGRAALAPDGGRARARAAR